MSNFKIIRVQGKNQVYPVVVEVGKHDVLDNLDGLIKEVQAVLDVDFDSRDDKGIIKNVGNKAIEIALWGDDNNFPAELAKFLYSTYKAPGLVQFIADQIYGQGIILIDKYSKKELGYNETKEIWDWLETWNYEEYIEALIADYAFCLNCFSEIVQVNGSHLDNVNIKYKVSYLNHIEAKYARLEIKDKNNIIRNACIGDWANNHGDFSIVPMFDKSNPTLNKVSVFFSKRKLAHFPYYSYPGYKGVLETWLPIANKIPEFHRSLLDNGINAKYHIEISEDYVERKKNEMQTTIMSDNKPINDISFNKALDSITTEIVQQLDDVMAGASNSGKYFISARGMDSQGNDIPHVRITAIENKVKELSESHIKLNEQVNSEYCSAFGVDPALASIYIGSKMSSGSEIMNSYNVHQQTKTNIPRAVICRAINEAISLNFPKKRNVVLTLKNTFLVKQETNPTGVLEGGNNE